MGECDATRSHVVMTEYGQRCLRWLSAKRSPQSARLVLRHGPRSISVPIPNCTPNSDLLRFAPILDWSPYDFRAPKSSCHSKTQFSPPRAREGVARAAATPRAGATDESESITTGSAFSPLSWTVRVAARAESHRVTSSYIESNRVTPCRLV